MCTDFFVMRFGRFAFQVTCHINLYFCPLFTEKRRLPLSRSPLSRPPLSRLPTSRPPTSRLGDLLCVWRPLMCLATPYSWRPFMFLATSIVAWQPHSLGDLNCSLATS